MKKAVVLLARGFEEVEALTCVDVLRRGGVHCVTCSISSDRDVASCHEVHVRADNLLKDMHTDKYDVIIIPGGMPGAENLKDDGEVVNLVRKFYSNNKIVAAICAGPIVLGKAGIIEGKKVTCYPGFEKDLGSIDFSREIVVQDGNIITSRGPATAVYFAFRILQNLADGNTVENLKKDMLLNLI
ncbi:MAG TPA: DJ-1 family protein [Clostridium sp.]|jgi:4-methyl-5(b-hydroxyethyl)-thiazole monophosphate biosynthesis|uniref:DJ-1 family glyoxalase III n=1 Tax=Clostridium lapidicellarium TaxID=3240931 RepID=A0ABV4DX80_9CLOT|nr:DJ-1 family glyoxalase III [uncultured Clostridium sp.]NLU09089.1 DJ-1/PfpI family protein [Clostridiales bacterium]HBC97838.1 DJ-1 family protein [Clostridium sp.]